MTDHSVNPFGLGAHVPPPPEPTATPTPPPYRGATPGPVDWSSFLHGSSDEAWADADPSDPPAPSWATLDGPATNGHAPEGQALNGHAPDGPASFGHAPEGQGSNGHAVHAPVADLGTIDLTEGGSTDRPVGGVVTADREPSRDDRTQVGFEPVTGRVAGVDTVTASRMDAIEVTSWFGKRKVLEGCTLSMEPGEVTALIGPSGCGKSTFLRALNRMHELVPGAAIAGQILLDGVDIYSEAMSPTEVRLRVGMVFQKPNPFPAMSIRENVLAGLKLSGTDHPDHESLVEQCLQRAGLWAEVKDRLDEGGMSLSGGQQQRLCIARSLAVHPDVLLMDEPCSALDPISTGVIEETIRELCHDITIIIVTHNMQQAQRVSDQCAFFLVEELNVPGRIVEHGPTERMFSNPSDPRTLDYVSGRFG